MPTGKRRDPARGAGGEGGAVVARLRRICLALAGVTERVSHGEPAWFAGSGRMFAMLDDHHHGAAHLSVWLAQPLGAQEMLIEQDPARFFRPPYVGVKGWVGAVLDGRPDWNAIAELVAEAHALVARPTRARATPRRPTRARATPRRAR